MIQAGAAFHEYMEWQLLFSFFACSFICRSRYEDYYLIGTDDKGNQGLYRMTNYGDTETVFEESRNNTKYKGISPDAKTVTLELYVNKEEKSSTTYKKYETGIEDTYGEGEGCVYESDEDPLDLYSPVEGKIKIKIR